MPNDKMYVHSGGSTITAHGRNLNAVASPKMVIQLSEPEKLYNMVRNMFYSIYFVLARLPVNCNLTNKLYVFVF